MNKKTANQSRYSTKYIYARFITLMQDILHFYWNQIVV